MESAGAYTFKIASALKSLARVNHNSILMAKVSFPKSRFTNGAHAIIISRMREVSELAAIHATTLEDYGIIANDLQVLNEHIAAFQDALVAPRLAVIKRKQIMAKISVTVDAIDEILRFQIDPLVKVVKFNETAFSNLFFNARIIIDRGSKSSRSSNPDRDDGEDTGIVA